LDESSPIFTDPLPGVDPAQMEQAKPQAGLPFSWWSFLKTSKDEQVAERVSQEVQKIADQFAAQLSNYCLLSLYEPLDSIDSWDSNRIYSALEAENRNHDKDVLLMTASPGGRIEPAYQISKICKTFAKGKFVVTIPRAAKSATTLIALGADEIHMGLLGELGPIDPQLGDLPALGVKQAIEVIASVCERYPRSANAFADYMSRRITIEQIGYCERVAESAAQYAERLLSKKEFLKYRAAAIAKQLVYAYKHHGFVIDIEEARSLLGDMWIRTDTPEMAFSESLYKLFDEVNFGLSVQQQKKMLVIGSVKTGSVIFNKSPED
jgi:hypothetical protein